MSNTQEGSAQAVGVAILTVSDSRGEENDTSGYYLRDAALAAGHKIVDKCIVKDDIYAIRAVVSAWIASVEVQAILITGGTGFSGRDSTPEAVSVLFDKTIEGFGEVFRWLSYDEIGTSTVQSRALGGLANNTVIFCLPGSTNACRTGWEKIIRSQLDSTYRPCNFVGVLNTRITTGQ
ncbi:MAG: molybdenum cofactor biosynthesis protein B [Spongiibacteraceae bacterium]